MDDIKQAVGVAVKQLFNVEIEPELTRPDEQFGDYATNVALQLASKEGKNPREIADQLVGKLNGQGSISTAEAAGPGFINLHLTDEFLTKQAFEQKIDQPFMGQAILVEFGDPNPFKEMHIGHLYSYVVGDAIASLLESAGATVRRLSYHGDVGLHVARAIWGMQQEDYSAESGKDMGYYYAKGAAAYEEHKDEIDQINVKVYQQDPSIMQLYDEGKAKSFANFDQTLSELGIKTDEGGRFLESEAAPVGTEMVKQNIGKVFQESEGAIVYDGEKVGLHTRVFITSKGLPTYEAKDLGLTELKDRKYPNAAQSIIITANEQAEYFKVMLAALNEINPTVAHKTKHLTHGFVSLSTGKMSSRTGDVYSANDLIKDVEQASKKLQRNADHDIEAGAIKYAFTKHRLGGNIAYDINESISLEGNSGPYLQYSHARARSILEKAPNNVILNDSEGSTDSSALPQNDNEVAVNELSPGERSLVRKLGEYPEVVSKAVNDLMPHHIATYLYELAQTFNRFYEQNRVIGDDRQAIRLHLVEAYTQTLKNGLSLLNIAAPDKM